MRLNKEIAMATRSADVRERLATEGAEPSATTPEEFGAFVKSEVAQWGKVIRDAKITPE
jgi:tripartite-type tricarboxylate transporter receptor subunit TctC